MLTANPVVHRPLKPLPSGKWYVDPPEYGVVSAWRPVAYTGRTYGRITIGTDAVWIAGRARADSSSPETATSSPLPSYSGATAVTPGLSRIGVPASSRSAWLNGAGKMLTWVGRS